MKIDIKLHKDDLPDQLVLSDNIAIDCEFMGLNVERDSLCLVQISTGNGDAHIVKLNRKTYDAPNLVKLLSSKNTQFIMHYARQDLMWLKYHLKVSPHKIFCTKLASKIARTASSNHGYKDLVKEICGKDISKKEQQSDWGNPKLSEKQISYAAQDTEYLFHIKNKLLEMLERENRKDLYEKCIKVIPILVDIELSGYKINVFEH